LRCWSVWLIADQKNPGAETGPTGPDRPGLPAVQQIACKKQEPRMKAEHHHDLKIHVGRGELKRVEGPCDKEAQSRLSQNSVAFRRNSHRENGCNSAPASGLCDAGLDISIAVSISGGHRSGLSDLSKVFAVAPSLSPRRRTPHRDGGPKWNACRTGYPVTDRPRSSSLVSTRRPARTDPVPCAGRAPWQRARCREAARISRVHRRAVRAPP